MLDRILNSSLFDKTTLGELDNLHKFILKKNIWQHQPLNASSFRSKTQGYGTLWDKYLHTFSRYGLIKADKVLLSLDKQFDYLLPITQYNNHQVCLFKNIENTSEIDLTCLLGKHDEELMEYQLYFHPYRSYGVYRLFRIVERNIVAYQPFLDINGLKRLNRELENEIESYLKSGDIWEQVHIYNVLIDFCIVSEVAFHSLSRTYEGTIQLIDELRTSLKDIYETIELDTIELIRKWLATEAERADPNTTVHVLLRMMKTDERLKLKGKLGLSMLLLEMAEVLRRASEYFFKENLDEEHKILRKWYFDDFMKKMFGTTRILDDPLTRTEFIRLLGLDYTLRARVYVEGETEYGFLKEAFSGEHAIQIINLKGQFVERGNKGIAFGESLKEDQRLHLFSFVFMDKDVENNIRVLKKAVSEGDFFGMFLISDPDFECGNFSVDELYKALCDYRSIEYKGEYLNSEEMKKVKSGKDFSKAIESLHPNENLSKLVKSEEWGKVLYNFTGRSEWVKSGKWEKASQEEPKFAKLFRFAVSINTSLKSGYEWHKQKYKVDLESGRFIDRPLK